MTSKCPTDYSLTVFESAESAALM